MKKKTTGTVSKKIRPAISPEARESQMISLAVDLAEQQLLDGTASAQVITHYLKLGTVKEKLEREKLEEENKLLREKTKTLQSMQNMEKLYKDVMDAVKKYSGHPVEEDEEPNIY